MGEWKVGCCASIVEGRWEKTQTLLSISLCIETTGLGGETGHLFTARGRQMMKSTFEMLRVSEDVCCSQGTV